jgi:hypothetical protein
MPLDDIVDGPGVKKLLGEHASCEDEVLGHLMSCFLALALSLDTGGRYNAGNRAEGKRPNLLTTTTRTRACLRGPLVRSDDLVTELVLF